ncbi:MAG: phosphorylase [Terriglobales bacterium]
MPDSCKVAIVAALEREVKPLVRDWRVSFREHDGRSFKFFEDNQRVLVCGGIGAEAARRAAEAVMVLYHPEVVQSVGFVGALDPSLSVGEVFCPSRLIDATDGSCVETGFGNGVLVSFSSIADSRQKARLAKAYGAQAVDMEAAAVARAALLRGLHFVAIKSISDESDFSVPSLQRFVGADGQFRTAAFVAATAFQPWLWPQVGRLVRNSTVASRALCQELDRDPEAGLREVAELYPHSRV